MTESKHTPGPWAVSDGSEKSYSHRKDIVRPGIICKHHQGYTDNLVRYGTEKDREGVYSPDNNEEEALANAKLMAKSPEMYDLLCEIGDAWAKEHVTPLEEPIQDKMLAMLNSLHSQNEPDSPSPLNTPESAALSAGLSIQLEKP